MSVILSNFQPRRREISAITNALRPLVTTATDHGYEVSQVVRFYIPADYGMDVEYQIAKVLTVPSSNQITVDLDTSALATFVAPSAPPAFTKAQIVPITGTTENETSIVG